MNGVLIIINCVKFVFQLLLSGDQMLQTASAKCIAAVLVHSGSQGSTPLIKADIPGDYAYTDTQTQ